MPNSTFEIWQEKGKQLIPQNYEVFQHLIMEAKKLMLQKNYDAAAVYAQMAAFHAQLNHCGFFVSAELEDILISIGHKTIPSQTSRSRNSFSNEKKSRHIIHIATKASFIGGSPKLMRRWIQQDKTNSHSIALTSQFPDNVPEEIVNAISIAKGKIYIANDSPGGIIARAKRLRQYVAESGADIVVLHLLEFDVVPMIAFANRDCCPPIIYTNHGDHWFWVGAKISSIVANLRESGMRLSINRRGIAKSRNLLLPTILEPIQRTMSRSEAKQQIGISQNMVMILSIARVAKYRTIDGVSFGDAHVQLLQKYKNVVLVVIGANEDWSVAIQKTEGRIVVLKETKETSVFYQAADIYVDSFPFVSITSLLEAGSYGTPLVSRYPYSSEECDTLGADMPGLTGNLIRVRDIDEYTEVLSRLVEEENSRISLGEKTKQKIEEIHLGHKWQDNLNSIYDYLDTITHSNTNTSNLNSVDKMFLGEPDVFLPIINGIDVHKIMQWYLPLMPIPERYFLWISLFKKLGIKKNPLNLLLSERNRFYYYLFRSKMLLFFKKITKRR